MKILKNIIWILLLILVYSPNASAGDFTDNGDGTVTDNETLLMWQQEDDNITKAWENAISYCEDLSLVSHADWRLPNRNELQSIVDYRKIYPDPAINPTYFPNTNSSNYWSSSSSWSGTGYAWSVDFFGGRGSVQGNGKTNSYYVRCVRAGQ